VSAPGRPMSCWLVGNGSLLVACAELLLGRGHRVDAVATPAGPAREWAAVAGIACFPSVGEVRLPRPEYLFSIVNLDVLTAAELRIPRCLAINFHSSPLPRYAGVHQTSWAIVDGVRQYGVTWHEMTEMVDGGDILRQAIFPVDPDETTLTLSIKCYDHGLVTFADLVADLERGTLQRRPQRLADRTYYPRRRRLPDAGLVSWQRPAGELERWCRAAELGQLDNEFGAPKVLTGDEAVVLRQAAVLPAGGPARPGTIRTVDADAVRVATAGDDLLIRRLSALDGSPLPPGAWLADRGLGPGDRLPSPDPALRERAATLSAAFGRHEEYWIGALAAVRPAWLPGVAPPANAPGPRTAPATVVAVPARLRGRRTAAELAMAVLAGWARYAVHFRGERGGGPRAGRAAVADLRHGGTGDRRRRRGPRGRGRHGGAARHVPARPAGAVPVAVIAAGAPHGRVRGRRTRRAASARARADGCGGRGRRPAPDNGRCRRG
jgi:methionyl-tRNA formyltransferase